MAQLVPLPRDTAASLLAVPGTSQGQVQHNRALYPIYFPIKKHLNIDPSGSGCGSVGRVVASDIRGPRFESSHQQVFIMNIFTVNC